MILKICFLLAVTVTWEASGASYSNVYVKTGPELEYLEYGAPATPYSYEYPSAQIAQYNAAPFAYDYPFGQGYGYRTSYPEQSIASIAPVVPNANLMAYTAPVANFPYMYGRNEPSSYSYVLINQGGGPELKFSDGEVIRGRYTFVQPEGLVPYVADSNQGFNAIIQTYVPNEPDAQTKTVHHNIVHHKSIHHAKPCYETKSEALTAHKSNDESPVELQESKEHHESEPRTSHENLEKEHDPHHESHEARHGSHEEPEIHIIHDSHTKSESQEGGHGDMETSHGETITVIQESQEGENWPHEHELEETQEIEHVVQLLKEHEGNPQEENEELTHESGSHEHHTHEAIVEVSHEPRESTEHHEVQVALVPTLVPAPQVPGLVGNNVSYNALIKCMQAAMARGSTRPYYNSVPTPTSPLTYMVLNKPC